MLKFCHKATQIMTYNKAWTWAEVGKAATEAKWIKIAISKTKVRAHYRRARARAKASPLVSSIVSSNKPASSKANYNLRISLHQHQWQIQVIANCSLEISNA